MRCSYECYVCGMYKYTTPASVTASGDIHDAFILDKQRENTKNGGWSGMGGGKTGTKAKGHSTDASHPPSPPQALQRTSGRTDGMLVLGIESQCIARKLSIFLLVAASSDIMPQVLLPRKIVTWLLNQLHWPLIPKTTHLLKPEACQRLAVASAGGTHQRVDLALCRSLVSFGCF